MTDMVWIHAHVEQMPEVDEYLSIPRTEWEAMTPEQQDQVITDAALDTMNNAGGCGASVVDESEVPAEYRDGAS